MNKTSKEELLISLRRRILTMDLEPGQSLDEATISRDYALSRTPVRDVLRQLAVEGYLTIAENRGAFVASMSYKALRDFFRTAPSIYSAIAALAAENWKPQQMDALRAAQAVFRAAVEAGNAEEMVTSNNRFHLIMGEMADNQYLEPSLQRLLIDHARIGQTFYRPKDDAMRERLDTACLQHDQFIEAIQAHDEQTAKKLAFGHWELSRDNLELFVRPDPLEMDLQLPEAS